MGMDRRPHGDGARHGYADGTTGRSAPYVRREGHGPQPIWGSHDASWRLHARSRVAARWDVVGVWRGQQRGRGQCERGEAGGERGGDEDAVGGGPAVLDGRELPVELLCAHGRGTPLFLAQLIKRADCVIASV